MYGKQPSLFGRVRKSLNGHSGCYPDATQHTMSSMFTLQDAAWSRTEGSRALLYIFCLETSCCDAVTK